MNPYLKYLGPEDKLHRSILDYIRLSYPKSVVAHPPNEGRRTRFERFKAKYLGISSGLPDILLFTPNVHGYNGLALEVKIKPNKMTTAQLEWHERLFQCRWQCACVYDLDGAMEVIDAYFDKSVVGSNSN